MSETAVLYVTCADHAEALKIAEAMVAERLVACANILPPHTAVYRWEGRVRSDAEVALIVKTRQDAVASVTARIKALHSYDLPCVVALPIQGGNADFLAWIETEVDAPA